MPQQEITHALLVKADREFDEAQTVDEVRTVFKRYYQQFGWKRLCRLFVLQYGADELWLGEVERLKKGAKSSE